MYLYKEVAEVVDEQPGNNEPLSRSLTSIGFSKAGSRGAATGGVSGGPCLGGRYPLISFLHSPPKGAYQKTYTCKLVDGDVDVAPVIGRDQALSVEDDALHIG